MLSQLKSALGLTMDLKGNCALKVLHVLGSMLQSKEGRQMDDTKHIICRLVDTKRSIKILFHSMTRMVGAHTSYPPAKCKFNLSIFLVPMGFWPWPKAMSIFKSTGEMVYDPRFTVWHTLFPKRKKTSKLVWEILFQRWARGQPNVLEEEDVKNPPSQELIDCCQKSNLKRCLSLGEECRSPIPSSVLYYWQKNKVPFCSKTHKKQWL